MNSWRLKGEGNANIVLTYEGDSLQPIPQPYGSELYLKSHYSNVCLLNPHDGGNVIRVSKTKAHKSLTPRLESLSQEIWGHLLPWEQGPIERELAYIKLFFLHQFGSEYVMAGVPLSVPVEVFALLEAQGLQVDKAQPGLLLPDHTIFGHCLPGFSAEGPTICIEVKPKHGYLPAARPPGSDSIKFKIPRFQLHMFMKHVESGVQFSKYNPLDLFSGDSDRCSHALEALFISPSNNLRIFRDGVLLVGGRPGVQDTPAGASAAVPAGAVAATAAEATPVVAEPAAAAAVGTAVAAANTIASRGAVAEALAAANSVLSSSPPSSSSEGLAAVGIEAVATSALAQTKANAAAAAESSSAANSVSLSAAAAAAAAAAGTETVAASAVAASVAEAGQANKVSTITKAEMGEAEIIAAVEPHTAMLTTAADRPAQNGPDHAQASNGGFSSVYSSTSTGIDAVRSVLEELIPSCSGRSLDPIKQAAVLVERVLKDTGVLPRLLERQQLDALGIETIHEIYKALTTADASESSDALVCGMPRPDALAALRNYLISTTAKDCSLMITLQRVVPQGSTGGLSSGEASTQTSATRSHILVHPETGDYFMYKLAFVDLDLKPISKIIAHYDLDCRILRCAEQHKEQLDHLLSV